MKAKSSAIWEVSYTSRGSRLTSLVVARSADDALDLFRSDMGAETVVASVVRHAHPGHEVLVPVGSSRGGNPMSGEREGPVVVDHERMRVLTWGPETFEEFAKAFWAVCPTGWEIHRDGYGAGWIRKGARGERFTIVRGKTFIVIEDGGPETGRANGTVGMIPYGAISEVKP